ncbi:GNAT family N-acetyltransferase [Photobacterium toruni]|uniref:GNAT family N-acetyltransferase n=1 Tax=Photobacterium toruni TaxID=1935446 RepID=A0ABU6L3V2_9GAMM|nr:GNAT family N-acetyltransferase [Photobacterium toruni]
MEIKKTTNPKDIQAANDLVKQDKNTQLKDATSIDNSYKSLAGIDEELFTIKINSTLIGFIVTRIYRDHNDTSAEIYKIFIDVKYRKNDYATNALNHIYSYFQKEKISEIMVEMLPGTQSFWSKHINSNHFSLSKDSSHEYDNKVTYFIK